MSHGRGGMPHARGRVAPCARPYQTVIVPSDAPGPFGRDQDAIQGYPVPVQFQIVIFAVIAAVVLFQLYNVLGKKVGRQPQEDAKAAARLPATAGPEAQARVPALDAATLAAAAVAARPRPGLRPGQLPRGRPPGL